MERNLPILIAEDDDNYAILLRRALKDIGRTNPTHIAHNGQDVINYLRGAGIYADRVSYPFPAVMFLDLKMPGLSGFEVLQWLRDHPECHVIPTLIFSGSALEQDVERAYALGAHGYLTKPARFEDLKAILNDAYRFWAWCIKPPVPKQGG